MAHVVFYDATELDKEQLTEALQVTDHYWEYQDDKISLETCNPQVEIISVFTTSTVTKEMMEAMPKLTLIACRSTGFNHIDLEAAKERGITVVNVPTYGDATVAEYAFTMLLALTRKLPEVLEAENERLVMPLLTGQDLRGKTFGVVGTGHIGQRAIEIAKGFSMRVIAYDKYPNQETADQLGFTYTELDDLLRQSDFITLHLPFNDQTHHILNHDRLKIMKPGAIVVNTGRGGLIDTPALIEELDNGHLGGAALDVLEGEHLLDYEEETALLRKGAVSDDVLRHSVEISALKKMPNVIVSPHNAFNTTEAIGRINQTTVDNIINFYNAHIPHKIESKQREAGQLILLRHAESQWNAKGIWSGIADCGLSPKGWEDTEYLGKTLQETGITIDVAIHTRLARTEETLEGVCRVVDCSNTRVIKDDGIMERDYGSYTGQDKWEMKEKLGDEQWTAVRRGWDVPVPHGETLKDTYQRVVPAYKESVLPYLREGKNVLLVSHGNSLRAVMKYLESISDEDIADVEMLINQVAIYTIDATTGMATSGRSIKVDTPTGQSKLA
jgi:D-lactate dehydrogenase